MHITIKKRLKTQDEIRPVRLNRWLKEDNENITDLIEAMALGDVKFRCDDDSDPDWATDLWDNQLKNPYRDDIYDLDGTTESREMVIRSLFESNKMQIDTKSLSAWLDSVESPDQVDRKKEFYNTELRIIDEVYHEQPTHQAEETTESRGGTDSHEEGYLNRERLESIFYPATWNTIKSWALCFGIPKPKPGDKWPITSEDAINIKIQHTSYYQTKKNRQNQK